MIIKPKTKPCYRLNAVLLLFILLTLSASFSLAAGRPFVLVLGTAQDAGAPQIGCNSPFCRKAWANPQLRQMVSSIALVSPELKERWIFDATPDLPEQFEFLKNVTLDKTNFLSGIFLTHAHIGHYTGLMYLGREALNTKNVHVFAMPRMKQMLEKSAPWSQLVSIQNILLKPITSDTQVDLPGNLAVTPFLVPHRDEFSETVGYKISSKTKSLIFIPDIDKWQKSELDLESVVKSADYLLIDGTFYAAGEIERPMKEVPHPFVTETMEILKDLNGKEKSKIYFTHFNHSNPLIQSDKRRINDVRKRGFNIARRGLKLFL